MVVAGQGDGMAWSTHQKYIIDGVRQWTSEWSEDKREKGAEDKREKGAEKTGVSPGGARGLLAGSRPAPSYLAVRIHTLIHRVGVIVETEVIPHHCLPLLQGPGVPLVQGHLSQPPGRTQHLRLKKDQKGQSCWHSPSNCLLPWWTGCSPSHREQPPRWRDPVPCLPRLTRPPPEFSFLLLATSGRREREEWG